MEELKPCPFCGGKADFMFNVEMVPHGVWCKQCKIAVKFMRVRAPKPHKPFSIIMGQMAEQWNRRTETPRTVTAE